MQVPFYGSSGFVGEGKKKLAHIVSAISTSNQMVTNHKMFYNRLNFNKPNELVKNR
jgi:hypothetical protein